MVKWCTAEGRSINVQQTQIVDLGWILEAHWMIPGKLTIHMLLSESPIKYIRWPVIPKTSNLSGNVHGAQSQKSKISNVLYYGVLDTVTSYIYSLNSKELFNRKPHWESQNRLLLERASISLQQIISSLTCTTIEVN